MNVAQHKKQTNEEDNLEPSDLHLFSPKKSKTFENHALPVD